MYKVRILEGFPNQEDQINTFLTENNHKIKKLIDIKSMPVLQYQNGIVYDTWVVTTIIYEEYEGKI